MLLLSGASHSTKPLGLMKQGSHELIRRGTRMTWIIKTQIILFELGQSPQRI